MTTILVRISCEETVFAAKAVWTDPDCARDIAANALQVLAKASGIKVRFFSGKVPKCFLGGLFYILGYRFNVPRTQREIADLLCTTEISVRKSYNSWLNEFPQLFTDVKAKLPNSKKPKVSTLKVNHSNIDGQIRNSNSENYSYEVPK